MLKADQAKGRCEDSRTPALRNLSCKVEGGYAV
jgi:hypothetical protein